MPYLNVDGWPESGKGYARLSLEIYEGFDNRILVEPLEKFDDWYPARVAPTPLQFIGANGSDIYHDLEIGGRGRLGERAGVADDRVARRQAGRSGEGATQSPAGGSSGRSMSWKRRHSGSS